MYARPGCFPWLEGTRYSNTVTFSPFPSIRRARGGGVDTSMFFVGLRHYSEGYLLRRLIVPRLLSSYPNPNPKLKRKQRNLRSRNNEPLELWVDPVFSEVTRGEHVRVYLP